MSQKIEMVMRILIGALLLNSGLNKIFNYMAMPEMTDSAMSFMMALGKSGYIFPSIALIEIIGGALLIWGRMIPFALIILAPIVYNIFMVHAILDPNGIAIGVIMIAALGWFAWNRKDSFKALFD